MSRAGIFASAHVASGGGGIVVDFRAVLASPSNTYSHTFSDVPIGAGAATRRVVVAIAYRGADPVTSVTIGGVAAVMDAMQTSAGNQSEIWSAVVSTGTTATIAVLLTSGGSSPTGVGIGVWTLSGGSVASTAVMSPPVQATVNMSLSTVAGDACIAVVSTWATSAGPGMVWNTATSRYDAAWDGSVRTHAGADRVAAGASTDMGGVIGNYNSAASAVAVAYR